MNDTETSGSTAPRKIYFTKQELAKRWNVSTQSIDNYCRQGWLPRIVLPAGPRFDLDDIVKIEKERRVEAFVTEESIAHHE